jgi:hypothetical protein
MGSDTAAFAFSILLSGAENSLPAQMRMASRSFGEAPLRRISRPVVDACWCRPIGPRWKWAPLARVHNVPEPASRAATAHTGLVRRMFPT